MASSFILNSANFGPPMDSDDEDEHMREIYLDFGDLNKTVKFLELTSLEPVCQNLSTDLIEEKTEPSTSKLEPILEDDLENVSNSSSDTDINIEVVFLAKDLE